MLRAGSRAFRSPAEVAAEAVIPTFFVTKSMLRAVSWSTPAQWCPIGDGRDPAHTAWESTRRVWPARRRAAYFERFMRVTLSFESLSRQIGPTEIRRTCSSIDHESDDFREEILEAYENRGRKPKRSFRRLSGTRDLDRNSIPVRYGIRDNLKLLTIQADVVRRTVAKILNPKAVFDRRPFNRTVHDKA